MALFFLSAKEKARLREAEHARQNRAEIIQAWSQGQVTRRDLVKWGLITAGGLWAPIHGLSPFAKSAFGEIPTAVSKNDVTHVSTANRTTKSAYASVVARPSTPLERPWPGRSSATTLWSRAAASTCRRHMPALLPAAWRRTNRRPRSKAGATSGSVVGPLWT